MSNHLQPSKALYIHRLDVVIIYIRTLLSRLPVWGFQWPVALEGSMFCNTCMTHVADNILYSYFVFGAATKKNKQANKQRNKETNKPRNKETTTHIFATASPRLAVNR